MANEDNMGALWKKNGPKGEYFSGMVEIGDQKINIVVFPNSYKKSENQPDYRIMKSRPKGEQQTQVPQKKAQEQEFDDFPSDDLIPF